MPLFSCFTTFGQLEFSSEPSDAEKIYDSLRSMYREPKTGKQTLDLTPGTYQEAKLYGWSKALGTARATLRQAGRELRAETSYYNLTAHEKRFKITPGPDDSIADRRKILAARQKAARGARYESLLDALSTILGSDLLAIRPITTSEAVAIPTDPSIGPGLFKRPDVPAKSIRILSAVGRTGIRTEVAYENWNTRLQPVEMLAGDQLCVDPGNWGLAEKLAVVSTRKVGSELRFTATFRQPHSASTYATTGTMPMWTNTKRHILIVVKSAVAISLSQRARVNDQLHRMLRAPTTWAIVEPTTPGASTVGPFTLASSPLGTAPLASMAIVT